jgi:hypothetical protein
LLLLLLLFGEFGLIIEIRYLKGYCLRLKFSLGIFSHQIWKICLRKTWLHKAFIFRGIFTKIFLTYLIRAKSSKTKLSSSILSIIFFISALEDSLAILIYNDRGYFPNSALWAQSWSLIFRHVSSLDLLAHITWSSFSGTK